MTSHLSPDPDDLNFSVLPPNDLLSEWEDDILYSRENIDITLLKAYQAGADAQLEEIIHWLFTGPYGASIVASAPYLMADLRLACRPKPNLKKQALAALNEIEDKMLGPTIEEKLIRRALESLPD